MRMSFEELEKFNAQAQENWDVAMAAVVADGYSEDEFFEVRGEWMDSPRYAIFCAEVMAAYEAEAATAAAADMQDWLKTSEDGISFMELPVISEGVRMGVCYDRTSKESYAGVLNAGFNEVARATPVHVVACSKYRWKVVPC